MAIDAGTAALFGVGGTATAAFLGVIANLRLGKQTTEVSRAQLERQAAVDEDTERDRAYQRLERENERLQEALDKERTAHAATRDELGRVREEAAQVRAENTVLSVQMVQPHEHAPPKKAAPRKRSAK